MARYIPYCLRRQVKEQTQSAQVSPCLLSYRCRDACCANAFGLHAPGIGIVEDAGDEIRLPCVWYAADHLVAIRCACQRVERLTIGGCNRSLIWFRLCECEKQREHSPSSFA